MGVATFERVRIVLSRTSHPGNIGAAARAMKTMGLHRLVLVNPKRFPDRDAIAMSSGALDVMCDTTVFPRLEDALSGTSLAIALTARPRELATEVLEPRAGAERVLEVARYAEVALVFGNEESGLSNEDIMRCQCIVEIPANPDYGSLNVAAAVQVMAYELRVAALALPDESLAMSNDGSTDERFPLATFEELEGLYAHFERALAASEFFDPARPKRLMERLRRLCARARLEREEVGILRGIMSNLEGHVRAARRATERS